MNKTYFWFTLLLTQFTFDFSQKKSEENKQLGEKLRQTKTGEQKETTLPTEHRYHPFFSHSLGYAFMLWRRIHFFKYIEYGKKMPWKYCESTKEWTVFMLCVCMCICCVSSFPYSIEVFNLEETDFSRFRSQMMIYFKSYLYWLGAEKHEFCFWGRMKAKKKQHKTHFYTNKLVNDQ